MDLQERIQTASRFLLQSPPGEINDVLNDVRDIIADDDALQAGVISALQEYNLEQFITVEAPGSDHQVIVSDVGRIESADGDGHRFIDPRSKASFVFDHLRLEATDPQPYEVNEQAEAMRAVLDATTSAYLLDHFVDGVSTVFSTPDSKTKFTIQIVANRYNPQNYWSGRWRSEYRVDLDAGFVEGKVLVNVHYYEQGNVQLATTHNSSFSLPSTITNSTGHKLAAEKILALIEKEESKYQVTLNNAYQDMSEKTFKSLRRALPMTRQKMDWDKVLGYKIGAELTSSRHILGGS